MISLRALLLSLFCFHSFAWVLPKVAAQENLHSTETTAHPNCFSYTVSLGAYNDFLNAVAAVDDHQLYSEKMEADGDIVRIGSRGEYHYLLADPAKATDPISDLNWFSMARYCNWQENNCPRTGEESLATTEAGTYALNEVLDENKIFPSQVKQKQGARNIIDSYLTIDPETQAIKTFKSAPDSLLTSNKLGFSTLVSLSQDLFSFSNGNSDAGSSMSDQSMGVASQEIPNGTDISVPSFQEESEVIEGAAPPLVFLMSVMASQQALLNPFAFLMKTVLVEDRNNEPDKNGLGAVDHDFRIGQFDVTAAQWCAFLNAVARKGTLDPYELFNDKMQTDAAVKCIKRTTVLNPETKQSEFHYEIIVDPADVVVNPDGTKTMIRDRGQFPITYVSYFAAVRFCNWLSNGQPNVGEENSMTTEDGPYTITGSPSSGYTVISNFGTGTDFTRWPQGLYRLPTESEWYKAAYYQKKSAQADACYWLYSTGKIDMPFNSLKEEENQQDSLLKNANYRLTYDDKILHKHIDQYATENPPYLTPVGIFKNSPGPFGTYDMGGNVEQWTDPQFGSGNKNDPGMRNIIRGGSWQSSETAEVSSQGYHLMLSSDASNTVGFRIVLIEPEGSFWNRTEKQFEDDINSMKTFFQHPEKYYDTMDYHIGMGVGYTIKKVMQLMGYFLDFFMSLIQQGIYYLSPEIKAYLSSLPINIVAPLEDFWLSALSLQAKYKGIVLDNALAEARKQCFVKVMESVKKALVEERICIKEDNLQVKGTAEEDIAQAEAATRAEAQAAVDKDVTKGLAEIYGSEVTEAANPLEKAADIATKRVSLVRGLVSTQGANAPIKTAVEQAADEAAARMVQGIKSGVVTEAQFAEGMDRVLGSMALDLGEAEVAAETMSLIPQGLFYTYGAPLFAAALTCYIAYHVYEGGEGDHNTRIGAGMDLIGAFFVGETVWTLLRLQFPWLPAVPGIL